MLGLGQKKSGRQTNVKLLNCHDIKCHVLSECDLINLAHRLCTDFQYSYLSSAFNATESMRVHNIPKVFFKVSGFLRCQVDSVRFSQIYEREESPPATSLLLKGRVPGTYFIYLYKERWEPKWKTKKELLLMLIKSMVKYQVNGGDSDAIIWRWWSRPVMKHREARVCPVQCPSRWWWRASAPGFHYRDFNYRHQAENGQKNEKDIQSKL